MPDEPNGGQTPLHVACLYNHVAVAKLLLEKGASVNAKDRWGRTPISLATDKAPMVQLLQEHGAMVEGEVLIKTCRKGDLGMVRVLTDGVSLAILNYQDRSGSTPLYYACQEGHFQVAKHLLERGADWTIANTRGDTPLRFTSKIAEKQISTAEEARKLLDVVVEQDALYQQLAQAVQDQDFTKARALLETGGALADAVHPRSSGVPPLKSVTDSNNVQFAKVLLRHGANVNSGGDYNDPPLITAIRNKNWEMFQLLIEAEGVNPDVHGSYGCLTPLHFACELGQFEMARCLMDKGADLHAKTDDSNGGSTPLHAACRCVAKDASSKTKLIELLLQKGADPNARDFDNEHTPLHLLATCGRRSPVDENDKEDYDTTEAMVKLLIQHGADINARDDSEFSRTPLNLAICHQKYHMAKALLYQGANVNLVSNIDAGMTILHQVCRCSSGVRTVNLVKLCIDKGADIHARRPRDLHSASDGSTPLHEACDAGQYHVIKFLLASGANLLATTSDGHTCLDVARVEHDYVVGSLRDDYSHSKKALAECLERTMQLVRACQESDVDLLRSLCRQKEDVFPHVKIPDSDGQYIIHYVCHYGLLQAAQDLVAKGADIHAKRDNDGKTPLDLAVEAGHMQMMEWIQNDGAHIDASMLSADDINNQLVEAIERGDYDPARIRYFIDSAGANVNCKDKYSSDRTLLHAAAAYGDLDVARLLIERGANVNACNSWGCSPLHASARRSLNVTKLLIANGADVHMADEMGNTPLHVASSCRHAGVTKLLLAHGANILAPNNFGQIPEVLARHYYMREDANPWSNTHNLVQAAQEGNLEQVEQLSEQDIFAQVKIPDDAATTVLSWQEFLTKTIEFVGACRGEKLEAVEQFLRLDVFLQKKIPETAGEFALHCVCRHGKLQAAQNLVRKGADVNITRDDSKTALALAAKHGHLNIVEWLIRDNGADLSLADTFGNLPLHHACREGHLDIVRFIVAESDSTGASNAKNWLGETPKDTAIKHQHNNIVSFLAAL